jgi:hypothetical protein
MTTKKTILKTSGMTTFGIQRKQLQKVSGG